MKLFDNKFDGSDFTKEQINKLRILRFALAFVILNNIQLKRLSI